MWMGKRDRSIRTMQRERRKEQRLKKGKTEEDEERVLETQREELELGHQSERERFFKRAGSGGTS